VSTREQVFWGWGEPGAGPTLPQRAVKFLRTELGVSGDVVAPPLSLDDVRLRESALPGALRERLAGVCELREDREARVLRCRGKSYLDLLAQRAGACEDAPDAVARPADAAQVQAVINACAEEGVAVVPFGGGTSVVGGLEPIRGRFDALVSLDLSGMAGVVSVDPRSRLATLLPGTRLPEADQALAAHGFTLGHFPQSYEWASVGGCVATRSAGQASTGFGRIDENVISLRCATPAGELATLAVPSTAAGPSLKQLVMGSEGTLGVITEVTMALRGLAPHGHYEGWLVPSFAEGWELLRALEHAGLAPDVARLSDENESRVNLTMAVGPALTGVASRVGGCVLICGWEGRDHKAARKLLRRGARGPIGKLGSGWRHARYAGPHLRDDLLDRGVMVETLETATTWSNLENLYGAVRRALEPCLVMCHLSHVYSSGASLYFTAFAPQDRADPAAQWQRFKRAACDAIADAGGTISHHHAVGRDHAPWLGAEVGELGLEVLRAVKERCDPAGIMNPGKLLPKKGV
jgi:alkyldihydroxyacetonephosphate synthase